MRACWSRTLVACAASAAVLLGGPGSARAGSAEIARVRATTAAYHRLDVATASGYGEFADAQGLTCIEDPGGEGAMGVHYVNGGFVGDGLIDAARPEALLYAVSGQHAKLLGVEYIVFVADWGEDREPPVLFGRQFELVESPNRYGIPPFYELHAWIWEHNPHGMFEERNPRIDC